MPSVLNRNDRCPCGSSKKFKVCCLPFRQGPWANNGFVGIAPRTPIRDRNLYLIEKVKEILEISSKADWNRVKVNLSNQQVHEVYSVVKYLWTPDTNLSALLPEPDRSLRGIYLGTQRPESIVQNIIRQSLYTDEIVVFSPFLNPWNLRPQFNPVETPGKFKTETLKVVQFLFAIEPWLRSGIVTMVPPASDFDYAMWKETASSAEERLTANPPTAEDMLDDAAYMLEDLFRSYLRLPDEGLMEVLRRALPSASDESLASALHQLRSIQREDPLALEQAPVDGEREAQIMHGSANLETAMYLAQLTGSYLFTNSKYRWKEILGTAHHSTGREVWSPITRAFQGLDFKFMENITPDFACTIREEDRLGGLRKVLRRIWNQANTGEREATSESVVLDFVDEFKEEYRKAEEEWRQIDHQLLQWSNTQAGIAVFGATGLATGQFGWQMPALGFTIATVTRLLSTRVSRARFRANTPLSVLIDLKQST